MYKAQIIAWTDVLINVELMIYLEILMDAILKTKVLGSKNNFSH